MKKRDKKKQAKIHKITLKRALYEKSRRRAFKASKAQQASSEKTE